MNAFSVMCAALEIETERRLLLLDRPAEVEPDRSSADTAAAWTGEQRIARVQRFLVVLHERLAVEGVGAGLGEDLDASEPGRSYSGDNGLELMRTSRIDDFEGRLPPVKPSI